MRFLVDIVHPAHVHFYRHLIGEFEAAGHEVRVVARDKEVTLDLLRHFGIPHTTVGRAGRKGPLRQGAELLRRDAALWRVARRFRPHVVLTRNPAGVQVARLARGAVGVFDTDDGRAAGVHFRAAAPFAHVITTPDCEPSDFGRKHVRYPSYKVLAYLHPDRYRPDPGVRDALGVPSGDPYFLARFVAMTAAHDRGEAGLDPGFKRQLVDRLRKTGPVFVTSEGPLDPEWEHLRLPTPPDRLHDVVAHAALVVTDSQTVAAEAAVLGVPSVRVSTFSGRLPYLEEIEQRYGLTWGFQPDQRSEALRRVAEVLDDGLDPGRWQERRGLLLDDKVDLTAWYLEFLTESKAWMPRRRRRESR